MLPCTGDYSDGHVVNWLIPTDLLAHANPVPILASLITVPVLISSYRPIVVGQPHQK